MRDCSLLQAILCHCQGGLKRQLTRMKRLQILVLPDQQCSRIGQLLLIAPALATQLLNERLQQTASLAEARAVLAALRPALATAA